MKDNTSDGVTEAMLKLIEKSLETKKHSDYFRNLHIFRKAWAGRTFRCKKTGVEFTIPEDVHYRQFFAFGDSFIDLGDGYYWRAGGDIEEVKEEGGV